ncbi:sulfate transporter family-domain-containing protein [Tribonema minus]|uniref:Sulfate transporter family-domain-containing protein n=1 Tax=Tribonema minus TaxID=303371 RepID=A0A835ZCD1_9STRA|nr:sulfate transporter family-domain-containing protein [Tribonema minus]
MPPAVTHADARPYVSLDERQHSAAKRRETVFNGVCHGLINGIIMVPVLVSFAAIIFKNQAFLPELPRLCKLVLISGTVHQMAFVIASSLPFAVGSVQDAGLIFLSSMATAVVNHCDSEGLTRETMLSTTCVVLSLSTAMLGVCLIGVGKLRVAQLVQYLPMPVVGGYLAYIGLFCGQAGLSFMAGISVDGVRDWHRFLDARAAALAAPGAAAGLAMYLAIARVRSVATLPACMSAILAVFFIALAATGSTLSDARAAGWVPAATPHLPLSSAWALFNLTDGGIAWGVLPDVIPSFLAMFFVVAFSSCLDVAAIEMELGKPLDYNRELQTVGLGNLLSGVTGGFTGSYIFSQTIFNLRAGVDTRWAGVTAVLVQLVVAIVPQSIVSFLPKAFFGSLLVVIAVDLMMEWLWRARHRMMPVEFCVCVFTFAAAAATSVVKGLALGTCAAAVAFAFSYAWSTLPVAITARAMDSTVMRTFEERRVLRAHRSQATDFREWAP